jgi:hypothetical protein
MARRKITWISPVGAANSCALGLAAVMLVLLVLFLVVAVSSKFWSHPNPGGIFPEIVALSLIMPFVYGAFGWVMGFVAAVAFNLTTKSTGGILVEMGEGEE